jgi:probable rRNA maturation factor
MLSVANKTRQRQPRVAFSDIVDFVLGPDYELSLVFCGDTRSKNLNRTYRGIDKPTNILSFPFDDHSGEIFIDLSRLYKEYRKKCELFFPRRTASVPLWSTFLFIHGLLHLKGFDHSDKMESEERKILRHFLGE